MSLTSRYCTIDIKAPIKCHFTSTTCCIFKFKLTARFIYILLWFLADGCINVICLGVYFFVYRNHAFISPSKREMQKLKSKRSDISKPNEVARGCLPIRHHHKCEDSMFGTLINHFIQYSVFGSFMLAWFIPDKF